MDKVFEIESLETFNNVSKDIINNLYNFQIVTVNGLDSHAFEIAKEDLKKLISSSNFETEKVAEVLHNKGWNTEKVESFVTLLQENKSQILNAALVSHNSKYGETLTEFDWALKLIMGTNELKTLSYPLLQLVLSTTNSNGEEKKTSYDINKDMLATLIKLLENIEKVQ